MTTQQSKEHHVGEWAKIRETSLEIAEVIFELADYDEKKAEEIWKEPSNDEVLLRAFEKTQADVLNWNGIPVERKNV